MRERESNDGEERSQRRSERDRFEHADPLAQPRLERDLDRACETGGDRQHRRDSTPGHGRERYSPGLSASDLREVLLEVARIRREPPRTGGSPVTGW